MLFFWVVLIDKCDYLGFPIKTFVHVLALQLTGLSNYVFWLGVLFPIQISSNEQ